MGPVVIMVDLDREFAGILDVVGLDVVHELEFVRVHLLIEIRAEERQAGNFEQGVEGDGAALGMADPALEIRLPVIRDMPDHPPVDIIGTEIVDIPLVGISVGEEPVRAAVIEGEPSHHLVADDRAADHGVDHRRVVAAIAELRQSLVLVGRRLGRHDDGAGGGVAAVKRALRSLQDFDLLEVEEFTVEAGGVGFLNAVDDEGEAVLRVARPVDAADIDLGVADFRRVGDQADAGGQPDEITRPFDIGPLQRLGVEHADGGGRLGQAFRAPQGRDDDLLRRRAGGTLLSGRLGCAQHAEGKDSAANKAPPWSD